MQLLRWRLRLADVEDFLRNPLLRLVRDPEIMRDAIGYYVSRHGPNDVWLTVYADEHDVHDLRTGISARLEGLVPEVGNPDDAILAAHLDWYRRALKEVSEIALDILHRGIANDARQILRVVRDPAEPTFFPANPAGTLYRQLLEPLLSRSAPYNGLSRQEQDALWERFTEWPGDPARDHLSPPGHWIWNLLV